jgi:hypothetical protein
LFKFPSIRREAAAERPAQAGELLGGLYIADVCGFDGSEERFRHADSGRSVSSLTQKSKEIATMIRWGLPTADDVEVRMPGINEKALQALTKAWIMTVIATVLLSVALAVSPVWDSAGYLSALPVR